MPTDEEIARLEAEHPDTYQPFEPRTIWAKNWSYFTEECSWRDWFEGDCEHPEGWHKLPVRLITASMGVNFQIMRRKPDGSPGEDWSPMNEDEQQRVRTELLGDRLGQLYAHPEVVEDEDQR